jgi:hypothetical protein
MAAAMVGVFCGSFEKVPRRLVLDIDDTEGRIHGGQELALFNAHFDSRWFLPIHIYEATSGKPVAIILRPGKTPDWRRGGAGAASCHRPHPRPLAAVDIVVRGHSHYGRLAGAGVTARQAPRTTAALAMFTSSRAARRPDPRVGAVFETKRWRLISPMMQVWALQQAEGERLERYSIEQRQLEARRLGGAKLH